MNDGMIAEGLDCCNECLLTKYNTRQQKYLQKQGMTITSGAANMRIAAVLAGQPVPIYRDCCNGQ
jgi:hypothetical protein